MIGAGFRVTRIRPGQLEQLRQDPKQNPRDDADRQSLLDGERW